MEQDFKIIGNLIINFNDLMETAYKAAKLEVLRDLRKASLNDKVYLPNEVENIILGIRDEQNEQNGH